MTSTYPTTTTTSTDRPLGRRSAGLPPVMARLKRAFRRPGGRHAAPVRHAR